jgi:hypothetical protein
MISFQETILMPRYTITIAITKFNDKKMAITKLKFKIDITIFLSLNFKILFPLDCCWWF